MEEKVLRRESARGGGNARSLFDAPDGENTGSVTVISGPYMMQSLPVAGLEVSAIRSRFASLLDIDPNSIAVIDGEEADEHTIVRQSSCLVFISRAGEKGAS
jgi:hypothetical protein